MLTKHRCVSAAYEDMRMRRRSCSALVESHPSRSCKFVALKGD